MDAKKESSNSDSLFGIWPGCFMVMEMSIRPSKIVALIPARGGSKSIPQKNRKEFLGIPLLAHSILVAKECSKIDRIFVSTDCPELAEIASSYGAEVPFLRSERLSQDETLDFPVFEHFLQWIEKESALPEMVMHLRPTSPMRRVEDLYSAIDSMTNDPQADSLRAVIEASQSPYKMWKKIGNTLIPFVSDQGTDLPSEFYNQPRQILPKVYWQTGYLDLIRAETVLKKKSMTGNKILALEIPSEYSLDLDNPFDWQWSESLWMNLRAKK